GGVAPRARAHPAAASLSAPGRRGDAGRGRDRAEPARPLGPAAERGSHRRAARRPRPEDPRPATGTDRRRPRQETPMTRHGPALLAPSPLASAGATYTVNYDTRAALDRISELRARIAEERETLQVLRVEWAWLNAPDRLARLVVEHNDRLEL